LRLIEEEGIRVRPEEWELEGVNFPSGEKRRLDRGEEEIS